MVGIGLPFVFTHHKIYGRPSIKIQDMGREQETLPGKQIGDVAFKPLAQALQRFKGDVLLARLQPVQTHMRNPQFLRKLELRGLAA